MFVFGAKMPWCFLFVLRIMKMKKDTRASCVLQLPPIFSMYESTLTTAIDHQVMRCADHLREKSAAGSCCHLPPGPSQRIVRLRTKPINHKMRSSTPPQVSTFNAGTLFSSPVLSLPLSANPTAASVPQGRARGMVLRDSAMQLPLQRYRQRYPPLQSIDERHQPTLGPLFHCWRPLAHPPSLAPSKLPSRTPPVWRQYSLRHILFHCLELPSP